MDIVRCPSCGQLAEVLWRTQLSSTDGSIEHVKLQCLDRHVLLMPAAGLIPMCSAEADGLDGAIELRDRSDRA